MIGPVKKLLFLFISSAGAPVFQACPVTSRSQDGTFFTAPIIFSGSIIYGRILMPCTYLNAGKVFISQRFPAALISFFTE